MKPKIDIRVIVAWAIISFLFLLLGMARWKAGFLAALILASLKGFQMVLIFSRTDTSVKQIVSRKSSDGSITAKI